ncbi:M28 family peptidase [Sphingomonas sp. KR3-1]|uniref:M28 family metallopeptidase n=1 Tax=Sphingomonas sp. KR3-1 TaxID=3156611 RepID=UPI0032B52E67
MTKHLFLAGAMACGLLASPAFAQDKWTVRPEWVRAHESFLASDALQGRGSATRDEAIAAAYVAAQFEGFGLKTAPGMQGYLQPATIVRATLKGASLVSGSINVPQIGVLVGAAEGTGGKSVVFAGTDPAALPAGEVVLASGDPDIMAMYRAAGRKGVKLLVLRQSAKTDAMVKAMGGQPRMPTFLDGAPKEPRTVVAVVPAAQFDALARTPGADVQVRLDVARETSITTNAIGWLPGTDPKAGVILLTAHLDHLGVRSDGVIMHGANDDASGTTAVLELARALAAGKPMKRGVLFVAYGAEEIGGMGSTWFGMHPPVPLADMVANIEFEMIGAQDPKLPAGQMMMTGFERSNLGETLKSHGALVGPDPYPEQHFFERSDNYSLALQGVVAHTISGWAVIPTYHTPQDDLASLDIAFMTRAIQSLVEPIRSLANSADKPEWKPGGRPGSR